MKKNSKIALSVFAGTTAVTALGMNRAYIKMRYGNKTAKPVYKFSEIAEGNTENVHLTAHRGFSAIAPENTLEAFRAAGKENFYALECDVHFTTDGRWVIIHDHEMKSMTDRRGDVKKFPYEELKTIKLSKGANIADYPDARMCTVEEYLDVCKEFGKIPMIEVKDKRIDKVENLYKIICDYGIEDSVIVISFHREILEEFQRLSPDMKLWHLMHRVTEEKLDKCIYHGFGIAFEAKRNAENAELIKKAQDNGITAACWTVDTKEILNKMLDLGIKYITTNAIIPD